ncbi:MAG: hypothetical protein QOJ09_1789 [Actinomycetota bacterium]|nr:hypothetical protein [Actinomycetota bacterium]
MAADLHPWYAHEHPDRPLVQGTFLCCCLLCAVSLERAGEEDANRPIVFHTGWGTRTMSASWAASHRERQTLDQMTEYVFIGAGAGNWVKAITVGPRHGRGARGWEREPDDPYPRPLERWPVCAHCGPLSTATFAQLVDFGAKPKRRTAKAVAAEKASRLARAALVERVEAVVAQQRIDAIRVWREGFVRPLVDVPDCLPDDTDDW